MKQRYTALIALLISLSLIACGSEPPQKPLDKGALKDRAKDAQNDLEEQE